MPDAAAKIIDAELKKMRKSLSTAEKPDPVEVALVEALASRAVRSQLEKVLNQGAKLDGVTLEAAGSIPGIASFCYRTSWADGKSHRKPPDSVTVLVEISPPKVIKVGKSSGAQVLDPDALRPPSGAHPPLLNDLGRMSASEIHQFNIEAARLFHKWLHLQTFRDKVDLRGIPADTTGTMCSFLLCLETTSEDTDEI